MSSSEPWVSIDEDLPPEGIAVELSDDNKSSMADKTNASIVFDEETEKNMWEFELSPEEPHYKVRAEIESFKFWRYA